MNMSRNYAAQLQKLSVDFRKRQKARDALAARAPCCARSGCVNAVRIADAAGVGRVPGARQDYLTKLKTLQDRGPGGDVFGDAGGGDDDYDVARRRSRPRPSLLPVRRRGLRLSVAVVPRQGFTENQAMRTATIVDTSQERDQEAR